MTLPRSCCCLLFYDVMPSIVQALCTRSGIKRWRHVYDVFCICRIDSQVTAKASEGFRALVQFDTGELGQQFPPFAVATKDTLQSALAQAEQDPAIRQEYEKHLIPLIFGSVRPSFDEAYGVFRQQAEFLIGTL